MRSSLAFATFSLYPEAVADTLFIRSPLYQYRVLDVLPIEVVSR